MEVYEIIFISISCVVVIILIVAIFHITKYVSKLYKRKAQLINKLQIMPVVPYLKVIKSDFKEDDKLVQYNLHSTYSDVDLIDKLEFYEYKIQNTYFPEVINNIIKEYIHYRIIYGFGHTNLYQLDYPYKIVFDQKYKLLSNYLYGYKYDPIDSIEKIVIYTLNFEGGFEINKKLQLEVKIE